MGDMADQLFEQEILYEITHGVGSEYFFERGDEMSNVIEGVIQKLNTKSGAGKKGPWTLHSALVNDQWFSFGFDAPPYKEGQTVKIGYSENQYGKQVEQHRLADVQQEVPDSSSKGSGNSSSGGGGNKGMAWGNASNVAASLLEALVAVDGLPLTASAGKANKAKRFDEVLEIFDKLRVKLYKDAEDIDRVLENVADFGDIQDETPPALPDGDIVEEDDDDDSDF